MDKTVLEQYVELKEEIKDLHNRIDRINAQLGWMAFDDQTGIEPCFYVLDTCSTYIHEMETYSWKEDKDNTPEDGHDHMVNSVQYAWIPYQGKIYKR